MLGHRLLWITFICLILGTTAVWAAPGDVDQIRQALIAQGANWQAGETPYTNLSFEAKRALLGLLPGLADADALHLRPRFSRGLDEVDEEVDWRDRNGANWVTPVRNQGQCGSCWAFGGVAAMESNILIQGNSPNYPLDLSEQYLVSCSDGSCNGWYADATLDFLQDEGTVDEACLPYYGSDLVACSQRCDDWLYRNIKLANWGWCGNVEEMKAALNVGPISSCFTVYDDFFSYSGGVYQHVWGGEAGGHMISIVGYSDAQQAWICKNSWGASWGDDGYFMIRMGYDECGIESWAPLWCEPGVAAYPNLTVGDYAVTETIGDNDGVLNPGETAQLSFTLQNAPLMALAAEIHVQITTDDPRLTILDGEAAYPNLPGSQTAVNSDPISISVAAGCALGPATINVYIYANESGPSAYYAERETEVSVSLYQYGYPLAGFQVNASPAVCDLDGDGGLDVITADGLGMVRATDEHGAMLPGFPYNAGVTIKASPAVADLDNDGDLEIVLVTWLAQLIILNHDGTPAITAIDLPTFVSATPALGDLDGDGDLEMVFGTLECKLFAFHHDGGAVAGFPFNVGTGQFIMEGALLMDVDGDDLPEIFFATNTQKLYRISPTGQEVWQFNLGAPPSGAPSGADLGDGVLTIIAAAQNGKVYYLDTDGQQLHLAELGHTCKSSPALADFNNDGMLEVALTDLGGYIHVLDAEGAEIPGYPVQASSPIWCSASFSDLNNDGHLDLLVPDQTGKLYALNAAGASPPNFPFTLSSGSQCPPAIINLDDDGDLEILVGTMSGLDVIDYKLNGGCNICWNTFRGNLRRTGFYGDGFNGVSVSDPLSSALPSTFALNPAHPNPFNPTTAFSYQLPANSFVSLRIYDTAGRLVATLVNGWREAGSHNVTFDGSHLPSGIYFYRLQAGDFRAAQKVVLLK